MKHDPTRQLPLEGPKLEHGAIGKDGSGKYYIRSAYRYFDSSPNLLYHDNGWELD